MKHTLYCKIINKQKILKNHKCLETDVESTL